MKTRRTIAVWLAVGMFLAGPVIASAGTVSVNPTLAREIRSDHANGNTQHKAFRTGGAGGGATGHGLTHLDLSSVSATLAGKTITSVVFDLNQTAPDGGSSTTDITQIDLHLATTPFDGGASWTAATGSTNWGTPGGDIGALLASSGGNPEGTNTVGPFGSTPALIGAVSSALAGDSQLYLIHKLNDESASTRAVFNFDAGQLQVGYVVTPDPDVLVSYHDGTAGTAPVAQAAGITATNISYESNDAFRTSFGGAGATPAGPTAGTASGSNWRLWRKSAIDSTLSSADDYAGFSFDVGAAAAGMGLTTLTFDLAAGAANNAAGGMEVAYEVFTQVNGGGFISRGGQTTLTELLADNERDQFSEVLTGVVDLSGVGALQLNDTVDIRIALANEDNEGQANIGLFMQGVELKGAFASGPDGDIPEPATMCMLSLAFAGLGGYVRRRRKPA